MLHASDPDSEGNVLRCVAAFLALRARNFRVHILTERWPSGLRRTPAKRVYPKRVPRVQIPLSPPLSARAPVAQLDRAPDYGSGGWGFKSLRARQESRQLTHFQSGLLSSCFDFMFQLIQSGRGCTLCSAFAVTRSARLSIACRFSSEIRCCSRQPLSVFLIAKSQRNLSHAICFHSCFHNGVDWQEKLRKRRRLIFEKNF